MQENALIVAPLRDMIRRPSPNYTTPGVRHASRLTRGQRIVNKTNFSKEHRLSNDYQQVRRFSRAVSILRSPSDPGDSKREIDVANVNAKLGDQSIKTNLRSEKNMKIVLLERTVEVTPDKPLVVELF